MNIEAKIRATRAAYAQGKLKPCRPPCLGDFTCNRFNGTCTKTGGVLGKIVQKLENKLGETNSANSKQADKAPEKKKNSKHQLIARAYETGNLKKCPKPCEPPMVCNGESGKCASTLSWTGKLVVKAEQKTMRYAGEKPYPLELLETAAKPAAKPAAKKNDVRKNVRNVMAGMLSEIARRDAKPAVAKKKRTESYRVNRGTHVYTDETGKKYYKKMHLLESIMAKHPELASHEDAMKRVVRIRKNNPQNGLSGWGRDEDDVTFPRVYFHWNGKKHMKLTENRMKSAAENGKNDRHVAEKAYAMSTTKGLGAVAQRFGLSNSNTLALMNRDISSNNRQGRGYYDYGKNQYVSADGTKIPGNAFQETYVALTTKALRPNFAPEDAENVVAHISRKAIVQEAERLERLRREVDARVLQDTHGKPLPDILHALLNVRGPLEARPLITGNVGVPGDPTSPVEQLNADKTGNGCLMRGKRWPLGQGGSLEAHQAVVFVICNLVARGMAKAAYGRHQPGLLALHSVGAGKTYELLSAIVAFWNVTTPEGSPIGIFPVSVRSNFAASGNDFGTLATGAMLLFPWFKSTLTGATDSYPFADSHEKVVEAIKGRLRDGHRTCGRDDPAPNDHLLGSFTTLARDVYGYQRKPGFLSGGKKMTYCVFLVDEIQMLFAPPESEKSYGKEYEQMKTLLTSDRDRKTTFVLGLTATPGDTVGMVTGIVKCIAGKPAIDMTRNDDIRDLVSIAYVTGNTRQFPKVSVVHECIQLSKPAKVNRTGDYWKLYINTLRRLQETHENAKTYNLNTLDDDRKRQAAPKKVPANAVVAYNSTKRFSFMKRARRAGEWIQIIKTGTYQQVAAHRIALDDDDDVDANDEDDDDVFDRYVQMASEHDAPVLYGIVPPTRRGTNRTRVVDEKPIVEKCIVVSPKIVGVVQQCVTQPGIHFVYSADLMTLRFIAYLLSSRYEFRQYRPGDTSFAPRFCFVNPIKPGAFEFGTNRATRDGDGNVVDRRSYVPLHAEVTDPVVSSLLNKTTGVLKNDLNKNGDVVKVVLATKESFKGVDIKAIRHIHCVSAMPDWVDMLQLVGRGTRNCGHSALPMKDWKCTVHLWQLVQYDHNGNPVCSSIFPDCTVFDRALSSYNTGYKHVEKQLGDNAVDKQLFQKYSDSFLTLQAALRARCQQSKKNADPQFPNRPRNMLFKRYTTVKALKPCTPNCPPDHACDETTGRCVATHSAMGKHVLEMRGRENVAAARAAIRARANAKVSRNSTPNPAAPRVTVPDAVWENFRGPSEDSRKARIVQAYKKAYVDGKLKRCPPCDDEKATCNEATGNCVTGESKGIVDRLKKELNKYLRPTRTNSIPTTVALSPSPSVTRRSPSVITRRSPSVALSPSPSGITRHSPSVALSPSPSGITRRSPSVVALSPSPSVITRRGSPARASVDPLNAVWEMFKGTSEVSKKAKIVQAYKKAYADGTLKRCPPCDSEATCNEATGNCLTGDGKKIVDRLKSAINTAHAQSGPRAVRDAYRLGRLVPWVPACEDGTVCDGSRGKCVQSNSLAATLVKHMRKKYPR